MECGPRHGGTVVAVDLFLNVDFNRCCERLSAALQQMVTSRTPPLPLCAVVKNIKILRSHCSSRAVSDEFGAARVYILSTRNYAETVYCGVIRKRVVSDYVQS